MTRFCASCTAKREDLVVEWLDGRRVLLCRDCSQGELRGGRWHFGGGRDVNSLETPSLSGNSQRSRYWAGKRLLP